MDDVQRLLIEAGCARLVTDYCHAIDHGEAGRIGDLFAEDGELNLSGPLVGRDAIARSMAQRQAQAELMSRHICANLRLDVLDENNARGVVYLTLFRHEGEPGRATSPSDTPFLVGEYRDTFARTEQGWRFKTRSLHASFLKAAIAR